MIAEETGSKALALAILEISAVMAATGREWARAARHYGASQAESRRQGFDANRGDDILAPLIAQARDALGDGMFSAAEAAGEKLDYEEAMANVRAWLTSTQ